MADTTYGKYHDACAAGVIFRASVTGVTIPVNANNLVSVFSLYNPASSGKRLQLLSVDLGIVLATTVVNAVNLYGQAGLGGAIVIPTSQTELTPVNGIFGGGIAAVGKALSAATHAGTPTRVANVATFGATTAAVAHRIFKEFDGSLILPPASIVSLAMSTAASTSSGMAAEFMWAEIAI